MVSPSRSRPTGPVRESLRTTDMTDLYPSTPRPPDGGGYWRSTPRVLVAAAGVLVGAILVSLVILVALIGGDDSSLDTTDSSTTTSLSTTSSTAVTSSSTTEPDSNTSTTTTGSSTTTTASSTTTQPTSLTTQSTTSTTESPGIYESAVWPWPNSSIRYTDPVDAARGFAEDFVGFTDPIIGEFMEGDSRSGEVAIQPVADGPITVVFVRQLDSDNTWWVLGTETANITIDQPSTLSTIDSPLAVTGIALAFEGDVNVVLRADGSLQPLVEDLVTGGRDEPRPFEGTFEWTNPGEGAGALIVLSAGGEDGRIWEAAVVRVLFAS